MSTLTNTGAIAVMVCTLTSPAASADPESNSKGWSQDKVTVTDLSETGRAGKSLMATTIMDAPLQKICALIQDYPAYPQFMPHTDATKVVQLASDFSLIDMTLKLPMGKFKRYRLKMQSQLSVQSCHVAWTMIPREDLKIDETIADTTGYWQLTPDPANSRKTLVTYFVYSDPGPVPFGLGWVVTMLGKRSLPATLEAVRDRVTTQ